MGGESSSSGEEDGDAEWISAINSVTSNNNFTAFSSSNGAGSSAKSNGCDSKQQHIELTDLPHNKPQKLKHYQIKAQKLLDDILEKTLEVVKDSADSDNGPTKSGTGVRLFTDAPPGIVFDHRDELKGPTKRPRIIPSEEIDEKSKKFKKQLKSIVVEGTDVIAAQRDRYQKLLAKLKAKDLAAKAAAKKEEERVVELKKVRGERWLPAIARDMRAKLQGR